MYKLLEPAVRLINRLPYAKKFLLIGLLIVVQASVLIFMLVSELNKNIETLAIERMGVQYCRALVKLMDEAQAYRTIQYAYSRGDRSLQSELLDRRRKVDTALSEVGEADKLFGAEWGTDWKLEVLRKEWETRKNEALQFDSERAQVAFLLHSRWMVMLGDYMQQVGNSSRLTLDNDLDTAYIIDSVLRKMPVFLDATSQAQAFSRSLPDGHVLAAHDKDQIHLLAGLVNSTMEQTERNVQTALRRNEFLKEPLKQLNETVSDALPIFIWNFEQKLSSSQGQSIPQQLLDTAGNKAVSSIIELYNGELSAIEWLLEQRKDRYTRERNWVAGFTVGILLLVCFLFLAFDMSVRKGLYQLNELMNLVAKGNLGVRGDIYSQDEMGSLTGNINSMLDSLELMVEEVRRSRDRLEIWNQELEQKVAERTASLRNLLNHAGQGFLSFGKDLKVAGEYSAECLTIFGRDILGEPVATLFYADDKDQRTFLEALFTKVFCENHTLLRETYFSLLPEEFVLNSRTIGVVYKMIQRPAEQDQREIMLILTDLTHQKAMENRVEEEKNVLAMVVRVVTHAHDFFASVRQYIEFCHDDFPKFLSEEPLSADKLDSIFRIVHTCKGTFGQLGMRGVAASLHGLEEVLTSVRAENELDSKQKILQAELSDYTPENMTGWLETDMAILKDVLGSAFFEQEDTVMVDNAQILDIEEKMRKLLTPAECRLLLPDLRRLRYKSLKEMLKMYPEYVLALAEKHEKLVHPFDIEGGNLPVDPEKYQDFVKTLGHVFRNAIAHGLENPDTRLESGKKEVGSVTCRVVEQADGIMVVISDDGRGIDPARIREIAVQKQLVDKQTAEPISDEEAILLIFADGFSSAEGTDQFSGRGVGLSAVRAEIEKIGGTIQVHSRIGHGATFQFLLPRFDATEMECGALTQMPKAFLEATRLCLTRYADVKMKEWMNIGGAPDGKLPLLGVTTFVDVNGSIRGKMVLSAEESLVKLLAERHQIDQDNKLQPGKWQENILAQFVGEIFDDVLAKARLSAEEAIVAEGLVTILAEDASAKYPKAEISTWMLLTEAGCLKLSLIY